MLISDELVFTTQFLIDRLISYLQENLSIQDGFWIKDRNMNEFKDREIQVWHLESERMATNNGGQVFHRFDCVMKVEDQRGDKRARDWLDRVRRLLIFYEPFPGYGVCQSLGDSLNSYESGLVVYVQKFRVLTPLGGVW